MPLGQLWLQNPFGHWGLWTNCVDSPYPLGSTYAWKTEQFLGLSLVSPPCDFHVLLLLLRAALLAATARFPCVSSCRPVAQLLSASLRKLMSAPAVVLNLVWVMELWEFAESYEPFSREIQCQPVCRAPFQRFLVFCLDQAAKDLST